MKIFGIDNLSTSPLEISLPSGGIFENPFLGVSVVYIAPVEQHQILCYLIFSNTSFKHRMRICNLGFAEHYLQASDMLLV